MWLVTLEDDRLDDRVERVRSRYAYDPGAREERALEDPLAASLELVARHDESGRRRRAPDGIQVACLRENDDVRTVELVADVRDA